MHQNTGSILQSIEQHLMKVGPILRDKWILALSYRKLRRSSTLRKYGPILGLQSSLWMMGLYKRKRNTQWMLDLSYGWKRSLQWMLGLSYRWKSLQSKNCTVWEHSLSGQVWTKCPTRPDTQGAPRGGCSLHPHTVNGRDIVYIAICGRGVHSKELCLTDWEGSVSLADDFTLHGNSIKVR